MRTYFIDINADFSCKHCGQFVSARTAISGVVNRNHCPYCLHSRHVDLFAAGDRLCACKALMEPIGLAFKRTRDKYAGGNQGELMLVHRCVACGDLSLNRIAADDDPVGIFAAFERGVSSSNQFDQQCLDQGIRLLHDVDQPEVEACLFGIDIPSLV